MSVYFRTAVLFISLALLLAAASCSGQSTSGLDSLGAVAKETAHARGHQKSVPHSCKPKSSSHRHATCEGKQPKRHWKPKCRCKCNGGGSRNQPPVASVALATTNGSTFELRPEGSYDPDGTIVKYEWDFESDGVYDFTSTTDGVTSHFFEGGDHTVTLRVTDNKGATARATFDLTANFPPTAVINIATANGTTFQFNGSESSDPEGAIQKWEWDFDGDGIFEEFYFSDPGSITHSFTGGDHQVSLRVTDGLDATDTETITVTGNNPPVAKITVTSFEDQGDQVIYTLSFADSTDAEGPIQQAFVSVDGGTAEAVDLNAPYTLELNGSIPNRTLLLTVVDGLDATDSQLAGFDDQGNVFFAEE